MDTLYVVMPAYNEEANIEGVVRDWYSALEGKSPNSRLVIADSGSVDRTHAILESLRATRPQLEVLTDTGRQHGPKLIALYRHAIERGADFIFQTDSDGQTDPAEFPAFWAERDRYDAILGNRTVRGDGKSRAMVEKVVCLLLKLFFGVSVPDANAPFRLMRARTVGKYMDRFDAEYNLPNIMLTTFFAHYGDRLAFRVISFKPRQGGVNSINIPRIFRIGWKAMGDFRAFKRGMK